MKTTKVRSPHGDKTLQVLPAKRGSGLAGGSHDGRRPLAALTNRMFAFQPDSCLLSVAHDSAGVAPVIIPGPITRARR